MFVFYTVDVHTDAEIISTLCSDVDFTYIHVNFTIIQAPHIMACI